MEVAPKTPAVDENVKADKRIFVAYDDDNDGKLPITAICDELETLGIMIENDKRFVQFQEYI